MQAVTNQGYPRNMQFLVKKLSGYSRNGYKVLSLNQNSAANQSIITVDLPNNCLLDLSTFSMFFNAAATGTGGVSCPRNVESYIERCEIEINGQTLGGGANFHNHLFQIISDTTMGGDCVAKRSVLQNAAIQTVAPTTVQGATQFCIQNWLGFLGSVSPSILSTDLTGNIRLRITLSNANVNVLGLTGSVSTGFLLTNIFFTCDVIQINDGMFNQLQQAYLNQGGVLEAPFKTYYSFTNSVNSMSQTTRFSLSSQSLNRIWSAFVNQGTANPIAGTGLIGTTVSASTAPGSGIEPNQGGSSYFQRIGNALVAYGNATNYTAISYPITSWQYTLNSIMYPNYSVDPSCCYANMLNSYGLSADVLGGGHPNLKSLAAWNGSFWVAEQKFNHGDVDGSSLISGLDTRGTSCQGSFMTVGGAITSTTTGTGASASPGTTLTVLVFCECTSTLRIGAGRNLEIVL